MEKVIFYEPIPERYERYINNLIPQNEVNTHINNIIATKCTELAKDFDALGFNETLLYMLFYKVVASYYYIPKISYDDAYRAIEEATCNEKFAKRLKNYFPQSDFFLVFKRLFDDIDELEILLYKGKKYLALKKYRDILLKISEDVVDKSMSKDDIDKELKARLPFPYNNVKNYQRRMANKIFKVYNYPKEHPLSVVKSPGYSLGCDMIQDFLIDFMLRYQKRTGYYYHPIDDNLEYFVFNNISVITYRYDDSFEPYFQVGNKKLTFKDYGFWALALSPDFKPEKLRHTISYSFKAQKSGEILFAPYEYMEEAIIKYANGDSYDGMTDSIFAREFLSKIGMSEDTPITDNLITNGKIYFKKPINIEDIKVKDISAYPTLEKLKSFSSLEERNKYIKSLIAKYKGDQTKNKNKEKKLRQEIAQKKFSRKKASESYRD